MGEGHVKLRGMFGRFALAVAWVSLLAGCTGESEDVVAPESGITILRFSAIIDGTGEALRAHEIAVRDDLILALGDDLVDQYPGATMLDKGDLVAIPGLIDAHVHITYALAGPPEGDAWGELGLTDHAARLNASARNARLTLETGVTTARDLFGGDGIDFELRRQIDNGEIIGPRLFLAGIGIHPSTLAELAEGEERNLVAEFAAIAAARAEEGADWVKIFASTGSADDLTSVQNFGYDEIKAAVDVAHARGLRVGVHSYGASAVPDAIRAGVDAIDHPVDMDDALLAQWAATDIIYVPTIDHNRYYADHRAEYGYGNEVETNLRDFVTRNVETLRRARAAGITIAMGSDAVMSMFGQNTRELEWFVDAGMTPGEALQSATVNGAKLLGQEDRLGRIAPGFAADIVGVRGDPLTDIRAITEGVIWVMKAGKVVVEKE